MNSSELRKEAREKLAGKWQKAVLITLVYLVFSIILNYIEDKLSDSISTLISLIVTIIEVPVSFGLILSFLKLYKGEDVGYFDFFKLGFNNFKKAWGVSINVALKLIVPIILLIVSIILTVVGAAAIAINSSAAGLSLLLIVGSILLIVSSVWAFVKSYLYQLAYIIAADNESLTPKEAIEKSAELMNGNRFKLFCLQFSFIGWAILAVITLGIGFLWLLPYFQFAFIAFYFFVSGNTNTVKVSTADTESSNDPIKGE